MQIFVLNSSCIFASPSTLSFHGTSARYYLYLVNCTGNPQNQPLDRTRLLRTPLRTRQYGVSIRHQHSRDQRYHGQLETGFLNRCGCECVVEARGCWGWDEA
jgi:hypothetical protein